MKKLVAALFSAKIEKITALGPKFPPQVAFWVDLGVPWGPKNRPQGVGHIGGTHFLYLLGVTFGPRSHFSRFWLPFWVPLGLI